MWSLVLTILGLALIWVAILVYAAKASKAFGVPPGLSKLPEVKTPPAPLPDVRVHVVPCMGGWTAYYAGEEADTVPVWPTKKEAIIVGKLMSRNKGCPLYIHKRNGMVEYKFDYK